MSSIILLMGPTASGKTDAAIELAKRHPIEIVSVDSAMVYRGLDIGAAKPDPEVRARIPHHLIDIRDAADTYSVGQFLRDAVSTIEGVVSRKHIPLLTGGTMLYFHAVVNGLSELPESDPNLRREIDARAAREGWPALHAELAESDPEAAARIHPNDAQRIQRALEVCWLSGAPISQLQKGRHSPLKDYRTLQLVLCPAERSVLHERIEKRLQTMIERGFLDEVRGLRARGDLTAETPSMRAVGYRQFWEHLDGTYDWPQTVARSVAATRQLAKRQLTWLRALPGARWIDPQNGMNDVNENVNAFLTHAAMPAQA